MDRVKMLQVIRLAIVREQASKFGLVKSEELAHRVMEAMELEEIEEFERRHEMDLLTAEPF